MARWMDDTDELIGAWPTVSRSKTLGHRRPEGNLKRLTRCARRLLYDICNIERLRNHRKVACLHVFDLGVCTLRHERQLGWRNRSILSSDDCPRRDCSPRRSSIGCGKRIESQGTLRDGK
jgi:hypothetical protein